MTIKKLQASTKAAEYLFEKYNDICNKIYSFSLDQNMWEFLSKPKTELEMENPYASIKFTEQQNQALKLSFNLVNSFTKQEITSQICPDIPEIIEFVSSSNIGLDKEKYNKDKEIFFDYMAKQNGNPGSVDFDADANSYFVRLSSFLKEDDAWISADNAIAKMSLTQEFKDITESSDFRIFWNQRYIFTKALNMKISDPKIGVNVVELHNQFKQDIKTLGFNNIDENDSKTYCSKIEFTLNSKIHDNPFYLFIQYLMKEQANLTRGKGDHQILKYNFNLDQIEENAGENDLLNEDLNHIFENYELIKKYDGPELRNAFSNLMKMQHIDKRKLLDECGSKAIFSKENLENMQGKKVLFHFDHYLSIDLAEPMGDAVNIAEI